MILLKQMKIVLAVVLLCISSMAFSQKFGHLNYGNLLVELPNVKTAQDALEAYQKPMLDQVKTNYDDFQAKYQAALAQIQKGELSPLQQKQKEEELQKEQTVASEFEKESQRKILAKREELLKPILDNIQKAITDVGTEGGYNCIFDTSNGQLLFAAETEDVMALVKAKMGIN